MKRVLSAFDVGQVPTIALVDTTGLPDFAAIAAAMQDFVDKHFAPVWGTPCKLKVAGKMGAGEWGILFADDSDVADALGYHDLTPAGLPLSKVFVKTSIGAGDTVSCVATHELAEMLVDPGVQMGALGPKGTWYAYETADAVQNSSFKINGVEVTNFVYPAWFEGFRKPKSTKFDHLGLITRPFQIARGGYMPVFRNGRWTQIFGSKTAERRFAKRSHVRTARR